MRQRFDFAELNNDKPQANIHSNRFAFGDEVTGETLDGELVQGRVTAVGDKTYRLEKGKMTYTIWQTTARMLPFEESTEGKRQAAAEAFKRFLEGGSNGP